MPKLIEFCATEICKPSIEVFGESIQFLKMVLLLNNNDLHSLRLRSKEFCLDTKLDGKMCILCNIISDSNKSKDIFQLGFCSLIETQK